MNNKKIKENYATPKTFEVEVGSTLEDVEVKLLEIPDC